MAKIVCTIKSILQLNRKIIITGMCFLALIQHLTAFGKWNKLESMGEKVRQNEC
jgi:hypothetical protein